MQRDIRRRQFLQWGLSGVGVAVAASGASAAETCMRTAVQTSGPFYPGEANILPINDLTRVEGATAPAIGQPLILQGVVRDTDCLPISGVNVEIWQACASGRYNHASDPNPAPLDPNFRYWGEAFTDSAGRYEFKTIKPGAYPANEAWDRPPHIHVRVAKRGYAELITQMYFKGEPLNDEDLILQRVPERLRENVIVEFAPHPTNPGTLIGQFDISIEAIK